MAMLPELQAEEQLAAIEAASVPHFKPEDQKSAIRRLQRVLRGEPEKRQSLHEALMAAGVPIKFTPKVVKERG